MSRNPHPVSERRLKTIYDALDNGNCKKALHEADKLLKKDPKLTCAKALRCLALLRLGRGPESEEQIELIRDEEPTDESTLQAMTAFFRELHRPSAICELYEKASEKQPNNEDILSNLFLSYVRLGEYTKQQKVARNLNKVRPNNQYYFWIVISILLQTVDKVHDLIQFCLVPSPKRSVPWQIPRHQSQVLLALAEKMLQQKEHEIKMEQEVMIYLVVLEMQNKSEEGLAVLNGPLATKLEPYTVLNKKIDLLVKLGRWGEVKKLVEDVLKEMPDSWHAHLLYLDSIVELSRTSPDRNAVFAEAKQFQEQLILNEANAVFKKRGPFLAPLEFYSRLLADHLPANDILGDPVVYLSRFMDEFKRKESCINDIRPYLFNNVGPSELLTCLGPPTLDFKTLPDLNSIIFYEELNRALGRRAEDSKEDRCAFVRRWISLFVSALPLTEDLLSTENRSSDRVLLIVIHTLFELYIEFDSTDFLVEAIILCHFGLNHSPSNSQFKTLLLKFYHLIGASEGAQSAYEDLEVKHMQLDTLGYFHVFPLLASATYSHATYLLHLTLKFFNLHFNEGADHITYAYKYEALTKIPEFIGIREKLNHSAHYHECCVEKTLLDLFQAQTYASTLDAVNDLQINGIVARIPWGELEDNRDFTVLWDLEAPRNQLTPEVVAQSYGHDIALLTLRSLFLLSIDLVVNLERPSDGMSLPRIIDKLEESLKPFKNNIPSPLASEYLAGPPVSRLILMLQINYFDLVLNQLRYFNHFTSNDPTNKDKCKNQFGSILLFCEQLVNCLRKTSSGPDLKTRRQFVHMSALFVELVAFSCIIVGACSSVLSKIKTATTKKNKKKKIPSDSANGIECDDLAWKEASLEGLANVMKDFTIKILQMVKSESELWKNSATIWSLPTLSSDQPGETPYTSIVADITSKISKSYLSSIEQMSSVLKLKEKWLSSLKL